MIVGSTTAQLRWLT